MRKLFLLLLTALVCSGAFGQDYFNHRICVPEGLSLDVEESVKDMASLLERATGKAFTISRSSEPGKACIRLQLMNKADLSDGAEKNLSQDGQSFYLRTDGSRSALIVGTGTNSLINGIYTFLQELGFRWYMPGDAWTIVPDINKFRKNISKIYTPSFQNRSYFGTGGIRAIPGIDPQNSFKQDFDLWNRRNRFNSDYPVKGHMGQAFYNENKITLDKHPEYFCNNKVNRYGRINIDNDEAVALYINWALTQIKNTDAFAMIGVDPADASGGKDDCLPVKRANIKSWSDKYFWLANQVAEKVKNKNIPVQLYAYASHAAPPSFPLTKNVYPVIIPYAFQNVADAASFIGLWSKKLSGRPMGIYDYWNITQWSNDLPQFNIYSIPSKLAFWKKNNVTTINLEATNAKGPMGHALWLASQMMWNTAASFDSLYNDFLHRCFGPAAIDIKRMYNRWSGNYQESLEPAFSVHDLKVASSKTKDPAILKRIAELKAYVHFMKLYYDYQFKPTVDNYVQLNQYIYSIHHLRLLQTSALQTLYIKPPKEYTQTTDGNVLAAQNAAIRPLDQTAIEQVFKQDLLHLPSAYTISQFSFDVTKAKRKDGPGKASYHPLYINGPNNYFFFIPQMQEFVLNAGTTVATKLVLKDEKGKLWMDTLLAPSKDGYESFPVRLPKGNYNLSFGEYARFSRIVFPDNIPVFSSSAAYDNFQFPSLFIYVPKDVSEIVYKDAKGPAINKGGVWIDPDGKTITPIWMQYDIYRIPVPVNQRGKLWTLNMRHRSFRILNIPNVFSLNPFEYQD